MNHSAIASMARYVSWLINDMSSTYGTFEDDLEFVRYYEAKVQASGLYTCCFPINVEF